MVVAIVVQPLSRVHPFATPSTAAPQASLLAQTVKNQPAMQETPVESLGREIPLEKGIATHYKVLAWRIPWTEEPGGLQSMRSQSLNFF